MRSQSATTKRAQRQASIGRLLDAAQSLFVSQGYRQTNLDQIASAAGLTKGAVYFYFRSKETVLLELLKRVQAIVVDQQAPEWSGISGVAALCVGVGLVAWRVFRALSPDLVDEL